MPESYWLNWALEALFEYLPWRFDTTYFRMSNQNKPKHPRSDLSCVLSECVGQDFYGLLTYCPPNIIQTHMFITSIPVAVYHAIFYFFSWDKVTLTQSTTLLHTILNTKKIVLIMYNHNLDKHGVNFHLNGINVQVKISRVCWTLVTIVT